MNLFVEPATKAKTTYVATNMRADDWHEISCQVPDTVSRSDAGAMCFDMSPHGLRHILTENDMPIFAFGLSGSMTPGLFSAWGFGTEDFTARHVFGLSSFIMTVLLPRARDEFRIRRVEIRSLASRKATARWIASLGATLECELPLFGAHGEPFLQWAFTEPRNSINTSLREVSLHPEHEVLQ